MTAARELMDANAFLTWSLEQEGKWELVDGVPVEKRSATDIMVGASGMHDRVVVNLIVALGTRLRGGPCSPRTADTALRTSIRGYRRPDVTIDCAPPRRDVYEAQDPRAVFEVLSTTTRAIDEFKKPLEYQRIASLAHMVLIDPDRPSVLVRSREIAGDSAPAEWTDIVLDRLEAAIELPALGITLPMSEVYAGVVFEPLRGRLE